MSHIRYKSPQRVNDNYNKIANNSKNNIIIIYLIFCIFPDNYFIASLTSMSIPSPPTWPRNSTAVTFDPSRLHTDPYRSCDSHMMKG